MFTCLPSRQGWYAWLHVHGQVLCWAILFCWSHCVQHLYIARPYTTATETLAYVASPATDSEHWSHDWNNSVHYWSNTYTRLTALCPGLPRWAGTRKVKPSGFHWSKRQWHQLGRMQVCTSLQTDNHASTPQLSFLQAGCPSCSPTNSVKALKAQGW